MASKNFDELLKELHAIEEPQHRKKLLVKADVMRAKRRAAAKPAATQRELGLLLKAAIDDAVIAGRLSGTSAMLGLKALGLTED